MNRNNKLNKIITYHLPTLIKSELRARFSNCKFIYPYALKSASLNLTDRCNLRCIMCKQWRQELKDELCIDEWLDAIKQLNRLGIKEINFTGGEPLLKKEVFDLAKYASSLGTTCGLTTNGYLINEEIVKRLIENGVTIFTISLDALEDDYDDIRGVKGAFQRVKNAINVLLKFKKEEGITVNISFVLMKPTLKHLNKVLEFCKALGLPMVVCLLDKTPYLFDLKDEINHFWINENNSEKLQEVTDLLLKEKLSNKDSIYNSLAEIKFFSKYFNDPLQQGIPCIASQTRIFIDSAGEVYGGCWSMGSFGNIKEKKLQEIINSENYLERHKNMFFKNCPGCSCGYSTNLRYSLSALINNFKLYLTLKN